MHYIEAKLVLRSTFFKRYVQVYLEVHVLLVAVISDHAAAQMLEGWSKEVCGSCTEYTHV